MSKKQDKAAAAEPTASDRLADIQAQIDALMEEREKLKSEQVSPEPPAAKEQE